MSDLVKKKDLIPSVTSTANPPADLLVQLRGVVSKEEEIKELFIQFRKESKGVEWLRDMVAPRVVALIEGTFTFQEILDGCQYLADEYNQLGEGYFIVSTDTGKTVAVLTEDDLYDPEHVTRYSGEVVQPLKRIKPHQEVALVSYYHEKERESLILEKLKERGVQTQLLKEDGDPRLRIATRKGRRQIAKDLGEGNPYELLRRAGGTTGMFLRHFLLESPPSSGLDCLEGTASFRSQLNVNDPMTFNLGYNRLGNLRGAAPQGWVRDIARALSQAAYDRFRSLPIDTDDLTKGDVEGVDLWLADPDELREIRRVHPKMPVAPIEGIHAVGLSGHVGYLEVGDAFKVESYERFGRWELVANVPYKLYLFPMWDGVRLLRLVGIAREGHVEY